jgi:hypothetical protein
LWPNVLPSLPQCLVDGYSSEQPSVGKEPVYEGHIFPFSSFLYSRVCNIQLWQMFYHSIGHKQLKKQISITRSRSSMLSRPLWMLGWSRRSKCSLAEVAKYTGFWPSASSASCSVWGEYRIPCMQKKLKKFPLS